MKNTRWNIIGIIRHLSKILIVIGIVINIAGLVFTAQSKSLVGPQSSFMYSNPEWTINGFLILGVGLVILFSGIVIWSYKKLVK
jgi:uncharacterized membrane protein YkgB